MLSVRSNRPLDPQTIAVLRDVDRLAQELNLPYFVAGAMAREILLTHVFGLDTRIATLDVDFAVAVADWQQFHTIKTRLARGGQYQPSEREHQRLYYVLPGGRKGYPVDIIPFRGAEQPPNMIAWPPEMKIMMNVAGYEEALATAVPVQIEDGLVVRVISLPGLALLKLFAWADRGDENTKDARDLILLFRSYVNAGNFERLYEDAIDIMAAVDFDIDLAGPRLLGRDVRTIIAPTTRAQIDALLGDAKKVDRLVTHMSAEFKAADDRIAAAERLVEQFKAGLTES